MKSDRLRVGDAERDQVASALHEHFAQGRLTREELDERLTAALSAKTVGDLRTVTEDLPASADTPLPAVMERGGEPAARRHEARRGGPDWGEPPWVPYEGGPPWARRMAHRGRYPHVGPPVGVFLLALFLLAAFGGGWAAYVPLVVLVWAAVASGGFRRARRRHRSTG
jgi:hypothetical protein